MTFVAKHDNVLELARTRSTQNAILAALYRDVAVLAVSHNHSDTIFLVK